MRSRRVLKQESKLWNRERIEDLKKELEKLQVFLNFKNRSYCKRFLKNIITKYFGDDNEY